MFTLRSKTIVGHVARGVFGLGFLALAMNYADGWGWWAAIPAIAALVCFRGCPMCWTIGLFETIIDGGGDASCADGSCAPTPKAGRRDASFLG